MYLYHHNHYTHIFTYLYLTYFNRTIKIKYSRILIIISSNTNFMPTQIISSQTAPGNLVPTKTISMNLVIT
jgi:hypothetical protein